jgi:hypothetical protein
LEKLLLLARLILAELGIFEELRVLLHVAILSQVLIGLPIQLLIITLEVMEVQSPMCIL